jgi:hypothetical protein
MNNDNIPPPTPSFFYNYNGVDDIINVPKHVTHVKVGPSATVIPSRAFCDCCQLITVEFPEGLEVIDDLAFYSCTSLTTICIPSTSLKLAEVPS